MTTLPDLLFVALFAVVLPLWDCLVFWPAFHRHSQTDPARARMRLWKKAIVGAWALTALGMAIWIANERSWTSFGFAAPGGWRMWTSLALVLLVAAYYAAAVVTVARSTEAQAKLRQQIGGLGSFMPHTRKELLWFIGVSLTAGFCEEFLFRGYFIWALSTWLGWWGAAALSLLVFAGAHAFQGWSAALRTGIAGAIYTLVVALFDSLWPAIALHALVDLGAGAMAWLVLRDAHERRLSNPA